MNSQTINIHAGLIERCRNGDQVAQYEIYQLYSKAMYNTALRICAVQEEAEDVLQEAFLSAFRNIASYREDSTFGAWLKRIVINKAITSLRRSEKEALMMEEVEDVEAYDDGFESVSGLTVERVKAAVLELPKGFRSVVSLYLFEGYDHKEISDILGITESTSKSQFKRGKDKLRQLLEKEVKYG